MLLADPTELVQASRLPSQIRKIAVKRVGLEKATGADLLVSTLKIPATSDTLLRRHCDAGMLIQRKTGGDFAASIVDGRLNRSLDKMQGWTKHPWLVVVGTLVNRDGNGVVDGRDSLAYASLVGALDWWQIRGGCYTILSDDQAFVKWLMGLEKRIGVIQRNPEHTVVRAPLQSLVGDDRLSFLVPLPGIGPQRARALLNAVGGQGGTLARALCAATNPALMVNIPGVNAKEIREWLGMGEGEQLAVVDERELLTLMETTVDLLGKDAIKAAPLYASLAKWLGVPGDWDQWVEDVKEDISGNKG